MTLPNMLPAPLSPDAAGTLNLGVFIVKYLAPPGHPLSEAQEAVIREMAVILYRYGAESERLRAERMGPHITDIDLAT